MFVPKTRCGLEPHWILRENLEDFKKPLESRRVYLLGYFFSISVAAFSSKNPSPVGGFCWGVSAASIETVPRNTVKIAKLTPMVRAF